MACFDSLIKEPRRIEWIKKARKGINQRALWELFELLLVPSEIRKDYIFDLTGIQLKYYTISKAKTRSEYYNDLQDIFRRL